MEKPRPRRRWWIWPVATVVVVAAATVGFSKLKENEFSFLDRFHPKMTKPIVRKGTKGITYLYIFGQEEKPKVLAALRRELTESKGYVPQDFGKPFNIVEFPYITGKEDFNADEGLGADFFPEEAANDYLLQVNVDYEMPEGGCLVSVRREPTWLERQTDAVKKLLHWD